MLIGTSKGDHKIRCLKEFDFSLGLSEFRLGAFCTECFGHARSWFVQKCYSCTVYDFAGEEGAIMMGFDCDNFLARFDWLVPLQGLCVGSQRSQ